MSSWVDRCPVSAIDAELAGVTVPVCALEHLLSMKRVAGRPRDPVDLDDLDAARPATIELGQGVGRAAGVRGLNSPIS